ncbi:hypothetical protein D3C81_2016220 [compost metagenome]
MQIVAAEFRYEKIVIGQLCDAFPIVQGPILLLTAIIMGMNNPLSMIDGGNF